MKDVDKMSRRELVAEVRMWRERLLQSLAMLSPDARDAVGRLIDEERKCRLQDEV